MEPCCRLCSETNPTLTSIATYRFQSVEKETIIPLEDLIEQYLEISITQPSFESLICSECLTRLEDWHSFRESCKQHERYIQQKKIKFEEVTTTEYLLDTIEYVPAQSDEETKHEEMEQKHFVEELAEEHEDGTILSSEEEPSNIVPKMESKRDVRMGKMNRQPITRREMRKPAALKGKRGRPKSLRESVERSKPPPARKSESDQPVPKQRPLKICSICGVARTDMAAHMRWHNNERPYQCPHCPKIFLNSSNLKNHINLHTRDKMYKCDICDKEFPSTTGRNKHRQTHEEEATHLCSVCGKSFKFRASLARHKLIHFEEPKQKCSVCDMVFLTKSRLSKHLMVHMNVKPFTCEVCGKAFNRKDNLKTHMKTHAPHRKREKPMGKVIVC